MLLSSPAPHRNRATHARRCEPRAGCPRCDRPRPPPGSAGWHARDPPPAWRLRDRATDEDIILDAYAEKIREAFKIFAENLTMGQNHKGSAERFLRSIELTRRASDMALE